MIQKKLEEKKEKRFQVWKDYGCEGWHYEEFDTFTDCIEYMKTDNSGVNMRITKTVEDEQYCKFIK